MADALQEKFDRAQKFAHDDKEVSWTNDQRLKCYALFKQGTTGDIDTERPGMFNQVGRAKWDAWKAVEGTSKEDAMQSYIDLMAELKEDWDK